MAKARWTAVFAVCLSLLALSASAQVNFTSFTSEHGRFTVLMPGAPKQSSMVVNDPTMPASYKTYSFLAIAGMQLFMIVYADYPLDFEPDIEDELINNMISFNEGVGSELVAAKRIEFRRGPDDLLPALEFTSANESYHFKSIVIWEGPRVYQVGAGSPKGSGGAAGDIDRFLASFVLRRAN